MHIVKNTPEQIRITRRHHPLLGKELAVCIGGDHHLVVRLADGSTMRVPRDWTDADGLDVQEQVQGTARVFSIEALRELIAVVDGLQQK
jgi:hypothetical protein